MPNSYSLLFKTAQSEFRTWNKLGEAERFSVLPIVELTRGRLKPKAGRGEDDERLPNSELIKLEGIYGFDKNVDWLKSGFKSQPVFGLDLTREASLSCYEIEALRSPSDGYKAWREFLGDLELEGRLRPVLQVNTVDGDTEATYTQNLKTQFSELTVKYDHLMYRASVIDDAEFFYDIILLKDEIDVFCRDGGVFTVILDHEFIRQGTATLHAVRTGSYISNLRSICDAMQYIVIGTSFPRDVEELGSPTGDDFRTEESFLYEEVRRLSNRPNDIFYGDYGSINPQRFDGVTRGWRPRVDYPTSDQRIMYKREKRERQGQSYGQFYRKAADRLRASSEFATDSLDCWGRDMILSAADGEIPSSAPAFWTSVRMEIFIQQQLKRLASSQKPFGA